MESRGSSSRGSIRAGTPVEVRNPFASSWATGFEVAATTPHGYRLLRLSDHSVLPVEFLPHDIRPATVAIVRSAQSGAASRDCS